MRKRLLIIPLAFSLFFMGCTKEMDFDNTENIDVNFGINLPIMTARLNLKNFIDSNEHIIVEPDGSLKAAIKVDDIFNFSINDFTSVPDQTLFDDKDILVGNSAIGLVADLDNVEDLSLTEFTFDGGKFEFTAVTTVTDPIEIIIKVKNGTQNGNPVVFNITTTGLLTKKEFDLTNLIMDFSGPSGKNKLDLEFSSSSTSAPALSSVNLSCIAQNVKLQSLKGNFGNVKVDMPSDKIDFNIDGFEKFVEGLEFTNPKINLDIENELGFSIKLDLLMDGENNAGASKTLVSDPLIISQPLNYGEKSVETLSLNNTNSTITDFLSISPNQLNYGGEVEINPGPGPYNNYLHKDFECKASLDVEIPLEIKVSNLVYETLMEDTELFQDESDQIEKVELIFKVTNTFPLDADINLILMDNDLNELDTIFMPLLSAAPVDASGITTSSKTKDFTVSFLQKNIQNLYNTKNMKFVGNLTSTGEGKTSVKIMDYYNVEIKLAAKVIGAITNEN